MRKVKLRFYTEDDLLFLHEMLSDKETVKYFPYMYTTCIEQSELRLKTRLMDQKIGYTNRLVIQDKKTRKPVGEISGTESREDPTIMKLAVIIHPAYRNMGFAKAGTFEFMKYVMKHKKHITKFGLEIADKNVSSLAVANKLEFDFFKMKNENIQYWEKDVK